MTHSTPKITDVDGKSSSRGRLHFALILDCLQRLRDTKVALIRSHRASIHIRQLLLKLTCSTCSTCSAGSAGSGCWLPAFILGISEST